MIKLIVILLCQLSITTITSGSNILGVFPHPGYSHFKVFYPILNALAEKGHKVTVLSSVKAPANHHANYQEIIIDDEPVVNVFNIKNIKPSRSLKIMYNEFWALTLEGRRACNNLYGKTKIIESIIDTHALEPFEVIITEMFNTDCHLGIAHLLSLPIVGLSSCALMPWYYDRLALPDYPSYIPTEFVGFDFKMDFTERMINFVVTKGLKILYRLFVEFNDNKIINEKLNIDVDVRDIAARTSLFLVNQHYSINGPRPLPPKVIEIGGVHIAGNEKTKGSLEKNIENFLNKSSNGVILISWGSLIKSSTIPKEKVISIIYSLMKLPLDIIWKWENDEIPVKNEKFLFSKWLPQKDVLCHPKVRLFWSHGGMLGTTEAVHCGVPLLITPFYGDQFLNAKLIEVRKMGKILSYEAISEESVYKSIKDVLQTNYSVNAKFISKVFNDRQNNPLETAVWSIEKILEYGNNTLSLSSSPAVNLNWFVYHSFDVILCLLAVAAIFIGAVIFLFVKFCKLLIFKKVPRSQKQKSKTS